MRSRERQAWHKPKLKVLCRVRSEKRVLTGCKNSNYPLFNGPGNLLCILGGGQFGQSPCQALTDT